MMMKNFVLFLCLIHSSICFGGDADEIMLIMQENFAACNSEDIGALLATCSQDMPDRKKFSEECVRLWKDKDIHCSLVGFELVEVDGIFAVAEIVQKTYATDRNHGDEQERFYRNGTGLLPDADTVRYMAAFKKDFGKWKCYMTISEPTPVK
jgi:hypothetical protein